VFGHVIDPQTGQPASAAHLAAVALPSATETDALSTALLTLGLDGHGLISGLRPGIRTLVAALTNGQWKAEGNGIVAPEQQAVGQYVQFMPPSDGEPGVPARCGARSRRRGRRRSQ